MIITKDYKMGDAILHDPKMLIVLNRFDIKLGFGDKTVEQICELNNINVDFFIEIANAFHDSTYFTENKLKSFSLELIVSFLLNSHKKYVDKKIPEIEKLINSLVYENEEDEKYIVTLKTFFRGYKDELVSHVKHEEANVYPYVVELEKALNNKSVSQDLLDRMSSYSTSDYKEGHNDVEAKLFDLKNIIIKYLPPPKNYDVCNTILNKLFRLEDDLKNHSEIEERVLMPEAIKMEAEIKELNRLNKINIV